MARVLNAFRCCQILHEKSIHASSPFTLLDIFLTFASIGSFLADISTGIKIIYFEALFFLFVLFYSCFFLNNNKIITLSISDIIVIIQYYINGHILWMLLTSSLVCVPSFLVQIFSIRWYIIDGKISKFLWLVHVLQLGVFQR